jgi:hypothetical protein
LRIDTISAVIVHVFLFIGVVVFPQLRVGGALLFVTADVEQLFANGVLRKLTLHSSIAALPTGSTLDADRAMDVVIVGACLAHGLETPVGGGGSEEFGVLFCEVAKGSVGGLAAE